MTKELTTQKQALEEWRQSQRPENMMNEIKFSNGKLDEFGQPNADYGKIFALSDRIKQEFKGEFFPIKVRKVITSGALDENKKPKYRIAEVGMGSPIQIMENGQCVFEGRWKDVQDTYQLKYNLALYVFWNDKVYRWKLGPAQVSSWFDIGKKIRKADYPHSIKVTGIKEQKSGSIFFNVLEFGLGEKFDPVKAVELTKALTSKKEVEEEIKQEEDLEPLPF